MGLVTTNYIPLLKVGCMIVQRHRRELYANVGPTQGLNLWRPYLEAEGKKRDEVSTVIQSSD